MRKLFGLLLVVPVILLSLASCSPAQVTTTQARVELNISVAASVTDAITEINDKYVQSHANVTITPNFASSGTLQKQIENGAPVDVFISAASAQMNIIQDQQLILDETRRNLLTNTVVLIVPADSTLLHLTFADLINDDVKQIAIGNPKSVPAGKYAEQAFDELGITAQLQSKFVLCSDIRQVLTYVESGNVDAGVVYLTDANISSSVKVADNAPDVINAKIMYPIAVIKASKQYDTARDYEDFLFSDEAKAVFEKYGFTVVNK